MAASPEVETVRRPGETGFVGRTQELASVRAASVIGREFEAAVLASVAGSAIGDVIVALDRAERAGLVEVTDRAGQAYR